MVGKLDDYLRFHQTALSLRAERQQLLASNIANADTPNYKARDIDFKQALQQAVQGTQQNAAQPNSNVGLVKTAAGHLPAKAPMASLVQGTLTPQYRTVQQGSVDGNTVDMDVERNHFVDNALRYQASVQLINGQIRSMMSAIQGQ